MVIRITEAQNSAMLAANEEAIVQLVIDDLSETSPETIAGIDYDTLRRMVKTAFARARTWGLSDPQDLAAFAGVSFEIAPNFDLQRNISRALKAVRGTRAPAMLGVIEACSEADWREAEMAYDASAWFPELIDD